MIWALCLAPGGPHTKYYCSYHQQDANDRGAGSVVDVPDIDAGNADSHSESDEPESLEEVWESGFHGILSKVGLGRTSGVGTAIIK